MADPIFKTYGTEDIDLSWRIGFSRYKAAWVKSSYVHHFRHKSIQRNELDFKKCVKQNNAIFYEKWRHTIDDLLLQKDYQGNSIYDCMTKEDIEDFWFLRRLNENIHFYSI